MFVLLPAPVDVVDPKFVRTSVVIAAVIMLTVRRFCYHPSVIVDQIVLTR